jgi:hypothetical protein
LFKYSFGDCNTISVAQCLRFILDKTPRYNVNVFFVIVGFSLDRIVLRILEKKFLKSRFGKDIIKSDHGSDLFDSEHEWLVPGVQYTPNVERVGPSAKQN